MINTIIKRDGTKEQFSAKKLNGWGEWASKNLGKDVDWSEVVLHVASIAPSEITSIDLHKLFIDYCLTKPSFAYNRMAGRLYIAKLYKELYGDKIPTIKDAFGKLVAKGLMSKKFFESYSDDDYSALEKIISHKTDFELAHYQINQTMEKYSLRDRVSGEYYETPQFGMMRVAMQMCLNKADRINRIKRHYTKYRTDKLNVPTPYYMNSGTDKLGLASCCVHNTDDTIGSLAAHNHISYMMTVNSAGQGNKIRVRSFGDPVRGGSISHQGLKPYLRAEVAMVNANLQNGRGGAETQTQDFINPEIEEILMLKNPMTPVARQVRGLDYSMFYNQFFVKQAATNKDVALFSYGDCPDLYEALDSGDDVEFEKLYSKYLKEGKAKKVIKARDLLRLALKESINVGRIYQSNSTWLNGHTPFKESIRLSNLCCVTGDQLVVTSKGIKTVKDLHDTGENLVLFNGESVVNSSPMLYIKDAEVVKLNLKNGMSHSVTLDHRVLTSEGVKYANELSVGDKVVYQTKKGIFGEKDMKNEAFLLGMYQGDGTQHKDSVYLSVWEDDFDLIDEIQQKFDEIHYKYGCDTYDVINQTKQVVGVRSRLPAQFRDCSIKSGAKKKELVSKTLSKSLGFKKGEIPQWILESNEETQWQYVRGLFFTDGSATYSEKRKQVQVSLVSNDKKWLEKLQILLSNLGANMSLYNHSKAGLSLFPDGKGGKKMYQTKDSYRLVSGNLKVANLFEEKIGIFKRKGISIPPAKLDQKNSSPIVSIECLGVLPTYCVEVESDDHLWVCNGIISHNCEIALPTHHYNSVVDLYKEDDSINSEVAMCSLAGINVGKLEGVVGSQEWLDDYAETAWVALDMIHTAITESDYPLPHIGYTAKKRMSAGVGIVDLAHLMAKNKLKYDTQEGRDLIHRIAESHYWFLLNASLELSKEFGVTEWMNKTKWLEGWTPLKTYCKNVDEVVTVDNQFDWEGISKKIVDNGGHAFSVLVAHMPAESSSIKSGATNGVYPVRDLDLNKSNDTNTVKYVVPESDKYGKFYQNAYDIDVEDIAKVYGILQKWADQGISADQWFKAQGSDKIPSHDLMRGWFAWNYYGVKTRYYVNTLTAKGVDLGDEVMDNAQQQEGEWQPDSNSECEGCQL